MRNPVDLAHLFANIMNSHNALASPSLFRVQHNPAVAPGREGVVAFMRHWFELSPTPASPWKIENEQFVEHWDELNLLEVFQQMAVIPIQSGATQ